MAASGATDAANIGSDEMSIDLSVQIELRVDV
jgi:hypothetical protein